MTFRGLARLESEHGDHRVRLNVLESQISELESQGAYAEDDLS